MLISLIYVVFMTFIFMTYTITIYKVCVIINTTWFEEEKYWLSCLIVIGVDFPLRFPFAEALPDVKRKIKKTFSSLALCQ